MLNNRIIEDKKLRHIYYRDFVPYLKGLENNTVLYTENKFFKLAKKFKSRWDNYIRNKGKKLIEKKANFYGFDKNTIWKTFKKVYMPGLIITFRVNIDRAFAQAQLSIERNLDIPRNKKGFFGLKALFSLKRQKLAKPGPIEGFSRFTRNSKRIYHINLKNYVFLLISTGQAGLQRKIEKLMSFEVGHDLVWIDQHPCWLGPNADEVCNRWRNRIVSLNGITSNFPKMETAINEKPPLFHPNCTHSFHVLTDYEAQIAIQKGILYYSELTRITG